MSTPFYDLASLVVVPSGYKASKVYAQKPLTTDGQLAFTRSTTATRVASNGLIEKVRTNYILQSNTFDTTWGATTLTVTSGATAPDGTATAWTAATTAASGIIQQAATLTGLRTFSIYAKQGTLRYLYMGAYGGTISYATFDLQTGTIAAGANARIESVGNGWYRCTCHSADGTTGGLQILPSDTISAGSLTNGNILIWKCQYESGDIATDYIPTTTAAVSVGPVANVPRLDYLGSSCPRLLLEPQRTNLLQYSEQFNNAYWEKGSVATITANSVISPDGTQNADTLTANGTGQLYVRNNVYLGTAQTCSSSIFAKKANHSLVGFRNSGTVSAHDVFNFDTKTWTNNSGATLSYDELGNGWFRLKSTNTDAVNLNYYWSVIPAVNTSGSENATASNLSVYIWGAQAEQNAAYATSYIPTLGAAVTRGADAASKTGISSLIGQTEGVAFIDFDFNGNYSSGGIIPFSLDGGAGSELYAWIQTNGIVVFEVYNSFVGQVVISGSIGAVGRKKIAFAYKQNDFAVYLNGTQVGTDTSGTVPTMSRLFVGRYYANDTYNINAGINQALLFTTRLTNAQLAELTTI